MNYANKLVLGTVQFGLDYVVNNQSGQVQQSEVNKILQLAKESGIKKIDTSSAYGTSESVLGKSLSENNLQFHIISKYPQSENSVAAIFASSLEKLQQKKLYGYLVHHFEFYQSHPQLWEKMKDLKAEGKIDKIGFSLYNTDQLQYLLDNEVVFDVLQFPYNLFDRQFDTYLLYLKQCGVEIHTRSVFLQGLFFKNVRKLTDKLLPMKKYLEKLHEYCGISGISMEQLALNYVVSHPNIDGVLIGVDNCQQLQANVDALQNGLRQEDIDFISSINVSEKELLNPVNWK